MQKRLSFLFLMACNLDSSLVISDASSDGTADAVDGLSPTCDLTKPFGSPTGLPGVPDGALARLSANYRDVFFQAILPGGVGLNDLYTAHRTDEGSPFLTETPLTSLNSVADDVCPTVSADGLTVIFMSSRENGVFKSYIATRASTAVQFANVAEITTLGVTGPLEPFLREDGEVLYFRGKSPTGTDPDLYVATLGGSGFANSVPLSSINTVSAETNPVTTPDELTIFWASGRSDGGAKGNSDIWTATRGSTSQPFGSARNLTELNTTGRDEPSFITRDGCTLIFNNFGTATAPLIATRPK